MRLEVAADEDVADVEVEAVLAVRHEEVVAGLGGEEEERAILDLPFGDDVDRAERIVVVVREVLVELLVLLLLDLALGAAPDGAHRVEGLLLVLLAALAVLILLVGGDGELAEADRVGDEVGVLLHERGDLPLLQIGAVLVGDVERDRGAGLLAVGGLDGILALAVGDPADGFLALAAVERVDRDLVRDHEGGVEANAELPDHLGGVGPLPLLERVHEGLGAGTGDGAEVVLGLLGRHADAVVDDGERLGVAVRDEGDGPFGGVGHDGLVREAEVLGLVDRVGGVGDELAEENFLLGVE